MNRFARLVAIAILSAVLSACTGTPTVTTQTAMTQVATPQVFLTESAGYPGATSSAQGYPGAVSDTPAPATPVPATPTADPTMGSAIGVIQLHNKPVTNVAMYLGQMLKDSSGQESVVSLDLKSSPWAPTTSTGQFHIVNVPPGHYGLVLATVTSSYHLLYPTKHESVILKIEAGKEVDLGVLNYVTLPIVVP